MSTKKRVRYFWQWGQDWRINVEFFWSYSTILCSISTAYRVLTKNKDPDSWGLYSSKFTFLFVFIVTELDFIFLKRKD
jgi:hypothetical protein